MLHPRAQVKVPESSLRAAVLAYFRSAITWMLGRTDGEDERAVADPVRDLQREGRSRRLLPNFDLLNMRHVMR